MDHDAPWYEALGRIVAAAAEFEGIAAYLAVRITDPPDADPVWTPRWQQQLGGRLSDTVDAIKRAALTLTRPEDRAVVVAWVKEGTVLMKERNRHVHSITLTGITANAFVHAPIGRLQPREQGKGPQVVDTDELLDLEARIRGQAIVALTLAGMVDIDRTNAR